MDSRERIRRALAFEPVDIVPLRIAPAAGGFHDHGQKLLDLIVECGHDFGPCDGLALPEPISPDDYDADGRYHAFMTDEWGTRWEFLIPGIWGHPVDWPFKDLGNLPTYEPPAFPKLEGADLVAAKRSAAEHRRHHYRCINGGSIFEKLHSVRPFEDVLVDVMLDTPEINAIADMICARVADGVQYALDVGTDGVEFFDDFGTQEALLMPPDVWRRFFRPRYEALIRPIHEAGADVHLHCCGQITELLEDFSKLGVRALWPQITLFDPAELSARCRDLNIALELHPDRGDLMQRGTPDAIRAYVLRLVEACDTLAGGSILYIEIDPGFPWANVEALFGAAMELRA
jgi:uroporphyrinogen decarboxylase